MNIADFQPQQPFLVGIDSDGCVFDSMELKHKECFIPAFINSYGLQGVSKYAREAAEFVNLYSKTRGVNRFPGLVAQLDWLRRRPEVRARGVDVPDPQGLRDWTRNEPRLSNPALKKAIEATGDRDLQHALAWSEAVNAAIAAMVRNVPPFPDVRACLERLATQADLLVVSATPTEALLAEWHEHDLAPLVRAILGQELGTKKEMLTVAAGYPADHALMIGDAPGDYQAAVANKCLFFPINPGHEEASWRRLLEEGVDRFFAGAFAGAYQQQLLDEFDGYLPESPPWPVE
ncbi:MAG TPA: HAD family hydrolase [Lacipirellulaceae bacterium]|nr:HAD family hydrolase [Lacipirellulaceae bacterium]